MKDTRLEKTRPKRDEMVAIIRQTVAPITHTEMVSFQQAWGRICAQNVCSNNTLPNRPTSWFDGIAVRYADFEKGPPDTSGWSLDREYVYCNTGIAMPDGYDTVIAIEGVAIGEEGLTVHEQPAYRGQMVNAAGSDMQKGEILIRKGEVIAPAHIGLLAAGGVSEVRVAAKPRVAVIPTGDELVAPVTTVPDGKNVDSNSYMIAAYLAQWGAQPTAYTIVRDDPTTITATLEKALAENDAAIIIAGSSLGTKDYTIRVLDALAEVLVPELAHGPGRKSSLSVVKCKPVLGIAGPPLGAQIVCDLYLAPFVSALRGLPPVELRRLDVISDDEFEARGVDFCERVHIYQSGMEYHIRSVFAPKTTRAQMQALANGNFYRKAGSSCKAGGATTVELLCPVEYMPNRDMLPEILNMKEKGDV